ncbi:hypothetical protein EVAR_102455_1 [Eumeta japonica]|uniref:Uncharacterized protein n=1 Tax=Eumeta variegata TaxID=151549 RepID=A0A4C1ZVH6_EUMVA|nr:hypothetical protein EVAR_102455_1 [Eumeta japonica]
MGKDKKTENDKKTYLTLPITPYNFPRSQNIQHARKLRPERRTDSRVGLTSTTSGEICDICAFDACLSEVRPQNPEFSVAISGKILNNQLSLHNEVPRRRGPRDSGENAKNSGEDVLSVLLDRFGGCLWIDLGRFCFGLYLGVGINRVDCWKLSGPENVVKGRKGASLSKPRDGNVPALTKGRRNRWRRQKSVKQQNRVDAAIGESASKLRTGGTSAAATASVKTKAAASVHRLPTISPPKLLVEVEPMDKIAALGKETDAGVFTAIQAVGDFARRASLREEIGRPSLSGAGGPRPSDLSGGTPRCESRGSTPVGVHPINRVASAIGNLAVGAKSELESLKNISKEVKESVILKLLDINELALRLDESRSRYVVELEREKARRAAELEAAEKRFNKINQENLDRYP